ncbi:hypothetical protein L207DRAFT_72081 [Hyaloscypha variabilis F]|uniref:Uncharacterized protein n=1 Tax=Hyaloscypha variabilis (strain UAMH 11265 / GT02V1 / F) TaxID=1149755 RepID=A0A2J6RFC2_HYAVF|nr:hypothetical protein L207DRAFT_72081 [Hyaloscypha variabilis F]
MLRAATGRDQPCYSAAVPFCLLYAVIIKPSSPLLRLHLHLHLHLLHYKPHPHSPIPSHQTSSRITPKHMLIPLYQGKIRQSLSSYSSQDSKSSIPLSSYFLGNSTSPTPPSRSPIALGRQQAEKPARAAV